jgi:hypothetical protein
MSEILLKNDDLLPLSQFAPEFAKWLSFAEGNNYLFENEEIMKYFGEKLTVAESIFCNNYARHLIFGTNAPNLNESSFNCSPMYRQALLEKIVRYKLQKDNYILPLAIQVCTKRL